MEKSTTEIKRFQLQDIEQWLKQLTETGCVVIKSIINEEQVKRSIDLLWEYLEVLGSGLKRDDPSTWTKDNWPGSGSMGFFVSYGGCHTQSAWFLRTRPRVQKAFASIWQTQNLISSFDTTICWKPWWNKVSKEDWKPYVENLHCDQNPFFKKGLKCVQGMIPLKRVRKDEVGGLMVVPNTNNDATQNELLKNYPSSSYYSSDWLELKSNDPFIGKGILVECDAGDLILWDSRTIHGGKICEPNQEFKKENQKEIVRMAFTVTMTPREWASQEVLEQRKQAFFKRIALTHWPHEFNKSGMGTVANNIAHDYKYEWPRLADPEVAKLI